MANFSIVKTCKNFSNQSNFWLFFFGRDWREFETGQSLRGNVTHNTIMCFKLNILRRNHLFSLLFSVSKSKENLLQSQQLLLSLHNFYDLEHVFKLDVNMLTAKDGSITFWPVKMTISKKRHKLRHFWSFWVQMNVCIVFYVKFYIKIDLWGTLWLGSQRVNLHL